MNVLEYDKATRWEKFLLFFKRTKSRRIFHPYGDIYYEYKDLKNTRFIIRKGQYPPTHYNCRHQMTGKRAHLIIMDDIYGKL